jgi:hypothetical protein
MIDVYSTIKIRNFGFRRKFTLKMKSRDTDLAVFIVTPIDLSSFQQLVLMS